MSRLPDNLTDRLNHLPTDSTLAQDLVPPSRSMHEGKDKKQLEEVYRLQAEAEQRGRLSAAEAERAGERSNPMPQKAPG
eukprot:CAMPEP_0119467440 /NCGR_PEP_ID=MMETSP1344-20130328/1625_1 /TAXON_ID=236787 /ORGANISM="Florenciella parvula, Strain CCMP2471" /LENGTH=78 /DNA_ID=CAMNT_0007499807 /DNA_START=307 /DNA_END=544 /DNA_ORIENTATION=-